MRVGTFTDVGQYANTPEGLHLGDDRTSFLVGGIVPIGDDRVHELLESGQLSWDSPEAADLADRKLGGTASSPQATGEPRVPSRRANASSAKRWWLRPVMVIGVFVLVIAAGAGGWKAFSLWQVRQAIAGAQMAAKTVGEALVAGDVEAVRANTVSMTPLALFTTAELSPILMGKSDDELVTTFETGLIKNRVLATNGQNLIAAGSGVDGWVVCDGNQRAWLLAGADKGGEKARIVLFERGNKAWKLVYWTPPMTGKQIGEYALVLNRGEGSLNGVPGVAETLAFSGIDYDRTSDHAKDVIGDDSGGANPVEPPPTESAADSSDVLSQSAIDYARQLGGKSHKGETIYFIIGQTGTPEGFVQNKLDQAGPLFGDMQSYFIVQKSDNFDGMAPGWFVAIEAYRTKAEAEENLDFAKRGFEDGKNSPYIKKATVNTADPIPVNYVDVNPTGN